MELKWIGAVLILVGCGGFGFSVASSTKRETHMLQDLLNALRMMESELQYKLTPLPELCRQAGKCSAGSVQEVFLNLARELDWQLMPDVGSCMAEAIEKSHTLPKSVRKLFSQLGTCLGRFDLSGQLNQLEYVRTACEKELSAFASNQEIRLRNYRTLGLCTGAALAVLFL